MATKDPKTASDFNDYLRDIFGTVRPDNARGERRIDTYKYNVFEAVFGPQGFGPGTAEKELIEKGLIIFEDSPASAFGIKAVGFTQAGWNKLIQRINALKTETGFLQSLQEQMDSDPNLHLHLERIEHVIISEIVNRREKYNLLLVEQAHQAELEQASIDAGGIDTIFGFTTDELPKIAQPLVKAIERIKKHLDKYVTLKKVNGIKTVKTIKNFIGKWTGSSFSIVAWAALFSGVRKVFGKIPILLGPVPLKHVDYVEVARSGKILKFRATGSVFLAKQEGGADAIKIEGTMYKVEFLVMFLLWLLFIYGQSKFKDMESMINTSLDKNVFQIRKLNDLMMKDTSLEKPSYEFHQTFPFVSRHFIIPHCYIETISIEDKLPLKDVLKYTILLRTYDKPRGVSSIEGKRGKVLYGIENKTKLSKIVEASLNAGWRALNATGWIIDETEWKIGSATEEGVLDTYYDVDWSTYTTISYLTLMSAVT